MKKNIVFSLVLVSILFISCSNNKIDYRSYIDISGKWQFAIDTANLGIEQKWYLSNLNDSILLPGTTDQNKKGFRNSDTTTLHLNRIYKYEGPAWYRKKVVIPQNYKDKNIQLFLERTKLARVWIDSNFIGDSKILQSPQEFDLSDCLKPGEHFITIRIDNSLKLTPYGNVHIYSDETQTNWNGILGEIFLEAREKTFISNLQVYPNIDSNKIDILLGIDSNSDLDEVDIEIHVERKFNDETKLLKTTRRKLKYEPQLRLDYNLGDESIYWDEYNQPLYYLTVIISHEDGKDSKSVPFGMRKFSVKETQFQINGRNVFLRGKNEAAVFPITGYPPMNVNDWRRIYKIAKSYGINHYRFHSYCPPEAAFEAADKEGIYLQAELPFWGGLESDTVAQMLRAEGFAMLKNYANHPSFVMFSHGNEIWSGHEYVEQNLKALKEFDNRPLYTFGSNNNIGYVGPSENSEFFVAARTPFEHDTILTHTRLTHAFVDSKDGGILNTQTPSTNINFNYAVEHINMPIISHEIGQYQIFPNYDEIKKYTGVLAPLNLEVFKSRLEKTRMAHLDSAFQKASGAWSAICYKAEMEAALRTNGFGGFQLLDLQDFPGQGTALVGILDAFMDSKNVVTTETWKQSCNDVVLLLEFPKYCWTTEEKFSSDLIISNYSASNLNTVLDWTIQREDGSVLLKGKIPDLTIAQGQNTNAGKIEFDTGIIDESEKLTINLSLRDTDYSNSYPIWIYKPITNIEIPKNILIAEKYNNTIDNYLEKGGTVLLFPKKVDVKENSLPGLFPPDFWNYGMFKGISEWAKKPVSPGTLGILTDPEHPIFNSFPTEFHTNWQWFSIIKESNSLILDDFPQEYSPIVQVIDNLERNHKLGLIFEFKVGKGKLLVCMSRLNKIQNKHEANQLYQSIINYINSEDFNPQYELSREKLYSLFNAD